MGRKSCLTPRRQDAKGQAGGALLNLFLQKLAPLWKFGSFVCWPRFFSNLLISFQSRKPIASSLAFLLSIPDGTEAVPPEILFVSISVHLWLFQKLLNIEYCLPLTHLRGLASGHGTGGSCSIFLFASFAPFVVGLSRLFSRPLSCLSRIS